MLYLPSRLLAEVAGLTGNQKPNDETEEAEDGAENLDDKNLDEAEGDMLEQLSRDRGEKRRLLYQHTAKHQRHRQGQHRCR
jgi:hypothetical protein